MIETVLWLIRHPEPHESVRGRCYGSLDVPLSPSGIQHANEIAQTFAAEAIDAIYSSPLQRCADAAAILAASRGCRVESLDALRELHFGAFEGRHYDEIAALFPDVYASWMRNPAECQIPGGENLYQMSARVLGAVREAVGRHRGKSIVLITHAGPIRVILADALGIPRQNIFRIGQRYGAMNRIRYFEENAVVDLVNF